MRALLAAAAMLLVLTAPAHAQEGIWSTAGKHSVRGDYTGSVEFTKNESWPGWRIFDVEGTYTFADTSTLGWRALGYEWGEQIYLSVTYETPGMVGRLENTGKTQRGHGSYRVDGDTLSGGWESSQGAANPFAVTEALTRGDAGGADPGDAGGDGSDEPKPPIEVNLTLITIRGGEVTEEDEETTGMVVSTNIDDDDNDGGSGGDGQTRVVSDKDDTDGVDGEDDLIKVRIDAPAESPEGAHFTLTHGAEIAVWRSSTKTGKVVSGETKLTLETATLYVEGVAPTAPETGAQLTLALVDGDETRGSDAVTIHTTRSAFLIAGHGCTGSWALARRLRSRAIDSRSEPTLVKSEGSEGYWSVYSFESEKLTKIALSTDDALISYDGHSNFGMGFAFDTGFSSLAQFMNIADPQVPVNWVYLRKKQGHPSLMFQESEYADDASTRRRWDPMRVARTVKGENGSYSTSRYPESGGRGSRVRLTRGSKRYEDHHYGSDDSIRIVIKAGARDMPAKKWRALFLNSCYSGQYYADSFGGRGDLFFTHDSASASQSSALFLLGKIDGKDNDAILRELNDAEDVHDYTSAR